MYDLTNLTSADSFLDLIRYSNGITQDLIGGVVILMIFFVLLLTLKTYDFTKALASSSFACFILSLLMVFAGMLNFMYMLGFLILTAFTVFYMYVVERN